ncbi:PepSY domain-containing protein [Methylophilus glucosoxydans]|uniref:PepSY domain-containing protein n=1 Tax=Methylophilus glucosoxydans TaxID=752553 RepID=A0ABW3GR15_9PROT
MNKILPYVLSSLLIASSLLQPAWADDDDEDDMQKMEQMVKAFGLISQQEAQTKALAAKPGVVKEIELERRKFRDGWDYEVEIFDAKGKEWEVTLDAKTGKVNSLNRDWF